MATPFVQAAATAASATASLEMTAIKSLTRQLRVTQGLTVLGFGGLGYYGYASANRSFERANLFAAGTTATAPAPAMKFPNLFPVAPAAPAAPATPVAAPVAPVAAPAAPVAAPVAAPAAEEKPKSSGWW